VHGHAGGGGSPTSGPRSTSAPAPPALNVYAGSGLGFNDNYAGIAIGRDGTAYVDVTGGLVALRG
jgi:hypothetical protein